MRVDPKSVGVAGDQQANGMESPTVRRVIRYYPLSAVGDRKMKNKETIAGLLLLVNLAIAPTPMSGQWFTVPIVPWSQPIRMIATHGNDVFVGTSKFPSNAHLYRSVDGLPWEASDSGISTNLGPTSMTFTESWTYLTGGDGIWRSSDNGGFWSRTGPSGAYYGSGTFYDSISHTTFIFCSASGIGLYRSVDFGETWKLVNTGMTANKYVTAMAKKGPFIFAAGPKYTGFSTGRVYRSSDYGDTWTAITTGLTDTSINDLASTPFGIVAGSTSGGIFISINDGDFWTSASDGLGNNNIRALAVSGSAVFAGTGEGAYLSNDSCKSWQAINEGLPAGQKIVDLIACSSTMLFAEAYPDTHLWMRELSEFVPVETEAGVIPMAHSLSQNYPNPFNASTSLTYSVSRREFVTLQVYDPVAREVATLVDGVRSPGTYTARWDAGDRASGVYLCKLSVGPTTLLRKMLLIR
jgi:hypothetical protein